MLGSIVEGENSATGTIILIYSNCAMVKNVLYEVLFYISVVEKYFDYV